MSSRPSKPKVTSGPKVDFKRHRAGKVPENYVDDLSDSDQESDSEQQKQQPQSTRKQAHTIVQFAQKDVDTGIKQTQISNIGTDRRLKRLQQAQQVHNDGTRRRRQVEEEEEESEDEEEMAMERVRMKQKAMQQQMQQEEEENEQEEDGQESGSEEESSEYESSSEEENTIASLPRPVFIPKAKRETILLQEKLAKEEEEREERLEQELEERKKQSHDLLAEELRREKEAALYKDSNEYEAEVDDTDGLDEEAEFNAWKIRELARIKRDREERIAREREEEELERRRALPADVRLKEDLERAKESKDKEKGQHTFMQKYYHKGAFYQDPNEEIFKRDYTAPTIDEVRNKDLLPKIMQVKNFGLAGRTKYTHLVDQDTSSKDSPWEKPLVKRRRKNGDE